MQLTLIKLGFPKFLAQKCWNYNHNASKKLRGGGRIPFKNNLECMVPVLLIVTYDATFDLRYRLIVQERTAAMKARSFNEITSL